MDDRSGEAGVKGGERADQEGLGRLAGGDGEGDGAEGGRQGQGEDGEEVLMLAVHGPIVATRPSD